MIYYIDAREAFAKQKTGKGQWTLGLIKELIKQKQAIELFVTEEQIIPASFKVSTKIFTGGLRFHWLVARYIATKQGMYISPISYISPAFVPKNTQCIITTIVHDMIAFRPGKHDKKARLIEKLFLRFALKKSDRIACVSTSTKDELVQAYPFLHKKDVRVVYAGSFTSEVVTQNIPGSILLCPATLSPRKNQHRLIQAYNLLPEHMQQDHPLVLAGGKGWNYETILESVQNSNHVTWLGYVSDDEYEELLNTCYALVLPSEYEGFGLQVLDALTKGVAILTSQGGSLQEVVGEAGLIVDPYSIESIAKGIKELCSNQTLHSSLRKKAPIQAKAFSWKRTTSLLLTP